MVVFGGNDDKKCFQEVHVLSVRSSANQGGGHDGDGGGGSGSGGSGGGFDAGGAYCWEGSKPVVVGEKPAARTGHAACLLSDGKSILVHGGWDPQDDTKDDVQVFDDAFLLDTETWEWKKVAVVDKS